MSLGCGRACKPTGGGGGAAWDGQRKLRLPDHHCALLSTLHDYSLSRERSTSAAAAPSVFEEPLLLLPDPLRHSHRAPSSRLQFHSMPAAVRARAVRCRSQLPPLPAPPPARLRPTESCLLFRPGSLSHLPNWRPPCCRATRELPTARRRRRQPQAAPPSWRACRRSAQPPRPPSPPPPRPRRQPLLRPLLPRLPPPARRLSPAAPRSWRGCERSARRRRRPPRPPRQRSWLCCMRPRRAPPRRLRRTSRPRRSSAESRAGCAAICRRWGCRGWAAAAVAVGRRLGRRRHTCHGRMPALALHASASNL